jgi:hypothetical protein
MRHLAHNLLDGSYLTSQDDHLVHRARSLVLQELADDVVAKRASPDDSEVPVSGHMFMFIPLTCVMVDALLVRSPIYPLVLAVSYIGRHPFLGPHNRHRHCHAYEAAHPRESGLPEYRVQLPPSRVYISQ